MAAQYFTQSALAFRFLTKRSNTISSLDSPPISRSHFKNNFIRLGGELVNLTPFIKSSSLLLRNLSRQYTASPSSQTSRLDNEPISFAELSRIFSIALRTFCFLVFSPRDIASCFFWKSLFIWGSLIFSFFNHRDNVAFATGTIF